MQRIDGLEYPDAKTRNPTCDHQGAPHRAHLIAERPCVVGLGQIKHRSKTRMLRSSVDLYAHRETLYLLNIRRPPNPPYCAAANATDRPAAARSWPRAPRRPALARSPRPSFPT